MRVKWDAFSTLDNAVVFESQIENLKDVTHRQAHSIVKCDGVEPAMEDIRMVILRNARRAVAWLRFPDLQTRQAFILFARPQILKAAIVVPRKKSAFVAFFNKWAAPRVSALQKELVLDSIEPSDLVGPTSPKSEQNGCQQEDSEIGPIAQHLSLACLRDCDDLQRARRYSKCSVDTTDTTNEGGERADRIAVQDGYESLESWWSRMGSSKSSSSLGGSLTDEEDESSSQRNANPSNGLIGPSFYAMSDIVGPSFHAMSNTAGPSFYAMSDTLGPSFHALSDGDCCSFSSSDSVCKMYEQMTAPKHINFKSEASRDVLQLLADQLF